MVLVQPYGNGGVAGGTSSTGSPQGAFAVVGFESFDLYLIAHEVGHNLGGEHAAEPISNPFPYSRGHIVDGVARDVMSGSDYCYSQNCPEQLQYANPAVSFIGNPGVPSGVTNQRDVVRSFREMSGIIYEYRGLWSGNENLGSGPISTSPSGNSWGPGHAEAFWRNSNNALIHKWGPNGWQGPQQIAAGPMDSEPEATSWGLGHQEVFWKGADQGLWHVWYANGWSGQNKLANVQMASKPYAIQWGPGYNEVFWKGTDGNVWHMWYNGSWNGPASLGAPCGGGCGFQGDPRPLAWNGGFTTIYVRGNDNTLWRKTYTTSWGPWEQTLSNQMASDPAPVSFTTGHHDVYWWGTDHKMYHSYRTGGQWYGPISMGTTLQQFGYQASEIEPVSWGNNHIDLYWRQNNGELRTRRYHGSGWGPVQTLATGMSGNPNAVSWGLDHISLFGRDSNGNLIHKRHQR